MVKLHAQVLSDLVIHLWGIQDPSHYSMAPEMWQAPLSISGNSLWSNMESAGKSMKIHHPPSCWWYPWLLDLTCELIECIVQHPWRIHGAAIYMVTWIPSIYPSHVSIYIYTSTMDPSWDTSKNCYIFDEDLPMKTTNLRFLHWSPAVKTPRTETRGPAALLWKLAGSVVTTDTWRSQWSPGAVFRPKTVTRR